MRALLLLMFLVAVLPSGHAQVTNVSAWSTGGQVWIRWRQPDPAREQNVVTTDEVIGYKIYARDTGLSFSADWNDWEEIGQVFEEEAMGSRIRDIQDIVPNNQNLKYLNSSAQITTLSNDQRLFVQTPHASQGVRYAVRQIFVRTPEGLDCFLDDDSSDVSIGGNSSNAVSFTFNSSIEIQPVLQLDDQFTATVRDDNGIEQTVDFPFKVYGYWVDGNANLNTGRADYPIMANPNKNGVPFFFVIWEPEDGLPEAYGLVHVLHGGQGNAGLLKPGGAPTFDLVPEGCLLVAHDDNNLYSLGAGCTSKRRHSWWFGYASEYDFFTRTTLNTSLSTGDSVCNYTQRRVMWVNDWIQSNDDYDGYIHEKTAIMGVSLGGHGVSHLARTFPESFSTATIHAHNPRGFDPDNGASDWQQAAFGTDINAGPPPTNLRNFDGDTVTMDEVWNYNHTLSATERDYPIMRHIHGLKDVFDLQKWDTTLVTEVLKMDSAGWGLNFFWDEREHNAATGSSYFAESPYGFEDKSVQPDLTWQMNFRSDESYPGFYLFDADSGPDRLPEIGDGNPNSADQIGSFGGFIGWEPVVESASEWHVDAFLIEPSDPDYSNKDTCLWDTATAYLTVRRPQQFTPAAGDSINFFIYNPANMTQRFGFGRIAVEANDLVRLEFPITLIKGQQTRIHFLLSGTPKNGAVAELESDAVEGFEAWPNPVVEGRLHVRLPEAGGKLELRDITGRLLKVYPSLEGLQIYTLNLPGGAEGVYFLYYLVEGRRMAVRKLILR